MLLSSNSEKNYMKKIIKTTIHIFSENRKTIGNMFREVDGMVERQVIWKHRMPLDEYAASEIAAYAEQMPCMVYIEHDGKRAAADDVRQLQTLGVKEDSVMMLLAEGKGDKHSMERLEAFLNIMEGRECADDLHKDMMKR